MALTDKVDDWWVYADTVVGVAVGLAVARYSFYFYSPTATPGYAASMRLSIFGGGVGGHAHGIPLPESPYDWVQLECLRAFSVWDLNQGPGTAAMAGVGAGAGFSAVIVDGFSNGGKPLFRNQVITGFGASAGASMLAGAGRWTFRQTTIPLTSQA
jgi:hypothetical protein